MEGSLSFQSTEGIAEYDLFSDRKYYEFDREGCICPKFRNKSLADARVSTCFLGLDFRMPIVCPERRSMPREGFFSFWDSEMALFFGKSERHYVTRASFGLVYRETDTSPQPRS